MRRIYHALMRTIEAQPARRKWSNLPRKEARALQALRSKPLALMPSDKGGEFCAVGLEAYQELGRAHLADTTTYRAVARMTAKTIEAKVNRAWKDVCGARGVPLRSQRSYVSSSTSLASFHHVIKTHKPGPELKIRPIVASRGSPTEKITWLLKNILSPLLSGVPAHVRDSSHLMTTVLATAPSIRSQHQYQCSLDVEALYTSVPVDDALVAVRAKLQSDAVPSPLQSEDVIKLLKTVFDLTFFHFEGRIYQQIAGLPMGCAVSGIVAVIFLDAVETRALALFACCPLYLGYVDDCYALVRNADEARELQACLNAQHPNLRFTLEDCARDGDTTCLSLLDLTVRIAPDGEASFDFYAKEAKSDIFLHKESALPWRQKAAAIRNEQRRVASRSSTNEPRNQAALREKLRANGYTARDLRRVSPSSRRRPVRTMEDGGIPYLDLPFLGKPPNARSSRPSVKKASASGYTGAPRQSWM